MRYAILAIVLVRAAAAHADASVVVTLNPQGEQLASDLGVSPTDLAKQAEARIDELYKLSRTDALLRAFANTAAFAGRGVGVEYDPDSGDVMVGATGAGVHGDVAIGTTNSLLGGSIINFAAMTGVNLARWHHPRWTVFASGYYEGITIHGLDGHLLTAGAHVHYRIVPGTHPAHIRWTGVAATSGLEYARWTVGTSSSLESHFSAEGAIPATIHMSSTGTLSVITSTLTMPVEITTGVRFLDTLALYTGAGLDLTAGSSTIEAQLDSVLSINADHLPVGKALIKASGSNTPSPATVHALLGVEIHTRHVRLFFQGAISPGEEAVSVGLRIAP